jgi:hypothetical protein
MLDAVVACQNAFQAVTLTLKYGISGSQGGINEDFSYSY